MADWNIRTTDAEHVLDWELTALSPVHCEKTARVIDHTRIYRTVILPICDAKVPIGIAIDAACEFMDKHRDGIFPASIQSESELMDWCLRRAWRQR